MSKATDIVAYTYRAESWTPRQLIHQLVATGVRSPGAYGMTAEDMLDQWASEEGIDRMDETTFDSGDFPKVIFEVDLDEADDAELVAALMRERLGD